MERLTLTTAGNLQPGDRFFKRSDQGKKVFEVMGITETWVFVKQRGLLFEKEPIKMRPDTMVIFLKHKTQNYEV